jgi:hypothetical protein
MRALSLAVATVGSILVLSPPVATAQQQNQGGGLGGALDTLNRAVNPDQDRDQRRAREDERAQRDRQYDRDQTSGRDRRSSQAPSYSRYSDQDLRDEAARLQDEERQIQRERRAVEDEMSRRGVRR